jgi:hypothetical protein
LAAQSRCAVDEESECSQKVRAYNYGHLWMKMQSGCEPSPRIPDLAKASSDPSACECSASASPAGLDRQTRTNGPPFFDQTFGGNREPTRQYPYPSGWSSDT